MTASAGAIEALHRQGVSCSTATEPVLESLTTYTRPVLWLAAIAWLRLPPPFGLLTGITLNICDVSSRATVSAV